MTHIKFGTDGWRVLIAREFTFENVAKVSKASALVMKAKLPDRKKIIVGYDRRFLGREFAKTVATVFAQEGYDVLLAKEAMPTPAFSWIARQDKTMAGAVVITASHNPPEWSGFKFKEIFGGSAHPDTTKAFEETANRLAEKDFTVPTEQDFQSFYQVGKITDTDPMPAYIESLKQHVDIELIRKSKFSVMVDSMYGAGSGHLKSLLESIGVAVQAIHFEKDPMFGGTPPEPIERFLGELCQKMSEKKYHAGFATDGDADRLGAVDETGRYFSTQKILSVVYWHMLKNRKKSWSIAKSVSTTKMVDLIAKKYGHTCYETPVGFKYLAEKIIQGEAHIAGEESGGLGIVDHIPERDSFLTTLLLLELMAVSGKGLAALYQELAEEIRPYEFTRLDLHVSQAIMEKAMNKLKTDAPTSWDGREVESLLKIDGYKFFMKDGSWLLIRPSGTEPIFRLYAEAETLKASESVVEAARTFVVQA